MAMTLGEIVVNVKSDTSHLVKGFNRAENTVSKASKNMVTAVKTLTAAYIGLNAIDLVGNLGRQADAMTNVNSKLKLVTKSTEELVNTQIELFKIAQKTRAEFTGTVDLYSRIARSTRDYNIEQRELLNLTDTINKSMIISGGTAQSMNAAVIQLGQAFSADFQAVGQELASIREQTPRLYQAILDGTDLSSKAFKKAAEDGELSSKMIIDALRSQGIAVDEEFTKMNKTIDQSKTQLQNSTTAIIGQFDKLTGASSFVAESISGISESIDMLTDEDIKRYADTAETIALIGGSLIGAKVALSAYQSVSKATIASNIVMSGTFGAVNRAILITTISTKALSFAMRTIPLVAVATTIGLLADAWLDADKAHEDYNETADKLSSKNLLAENRARVKQLEDLIESGKFASDVVDNWRKNLKKLNEEYDVLSSKDSGDSDKSAEETLKFLQLTNKAQNEAAKALAQFNREVFDAEFEAKQALAKFDEEQLDKKLQGEQEYNAHVVEFYAMRDELEAQSTELITSDIDKINEKMLPMFELMQDMWNPEQIETFFDVWNKQLKKVTKTTKKYEGLGSSESSVELKGQSKAIQDIGKAFGDIGKEQNKWEKFNDENAATSDDKRKHLENQLEGYSALSGVMSNMYAEGSSAANAMIVVQQALSVVAGITAIANAMANGDGYTAVARGLAVAATLASFGWGGGGGGGSVSSMSETEKNIQGIEDQYNPTLEKLDRQIELLEAIDRNGSAASLSVQLASTTFDRDYGIFVEESLSKVWDRMNQDFGGGGSGAVIARTERTVEDALGFNLVNVDLSNWASTAIDKEALREGFNFAKLLEGFFTGVLTDTNVISGHAGAYQAMLDKGWEEAGRTPQQQYQANLNSFISGYQDLVSEFTLSLLDSMQELKDAGEDFKNAYDSVTNSTFFQTQRLVEAFSDVDRLRGGESFADYLKGEVENIAELQDFLTEDRIQLLLLEDPTKLEEQIKLVQELEKATGITFENGAKDALNYLDSIELVSEAIAGSNENIKEWKDSFKDSDELLLDMASSLGMGIATTEGELTSLFNSLKGGIGGLTDAELDFLEANKDFVNEFKSAMLGMTDSIDEAIISIRGNILSDDFTSAQNSSIVQYWNKREELDELTSQSALLSQSQQDELSNLVDDINRLSLNIQSQSIGDNTEISNQLVSELTNLKNNLDFENRILNVNIVGIQTSLNGLVANNINYGEAPIYNVNDSSVPIYTSDGSLALSNNSDIMMILQSMNERLENIEESSESSASDLEAIYNAGITIDGIVQTQEVVT